MTTTFENAQVGDRVWDVRLGWGVITGIVQHGRYPLLVQFGNTDNRVGTFTTEGRFNVEDVGRTLFWDVVEIVAPEQPMIKVNGFDVPKPCQEPLKDGQLYYFPMIYPKGWTVLCASWGFNPTWDDYVLNMNMLHVEEKNARAHGMALAWEGTTGEKP